ncbi:Proteinase inhibitor I13, potato inhibitor I [Corchorus olitorius]|uniref:Proteinase inhibitor I13, potato inhibitor I n=1 Tax=Corchorus olitorius TaxID=93759 RepID=A0A1R3K1Z8_9ROSI|nr:Proteinase inhibitor I13, potato inhibitor I [Corchorus olitorius]
MASKCQGKSSWPELVGVKGEEAEATIEKENPLVDARIVVKGRNSVTMDFRCDRVWVWVDDAGYVVDVPFIG